MVPNPLSVRSGKGLKNCRNYGGARWKIRRRIIAGTLIYCAVLPLYVMVHGVDSESIGEAIITNCFWLAGAVIGAYIFGATWDDKNQKEYDDENFDYVQRGGGRDENQEPVGSARAGRDNDDFRS